MAYSGQCLTSESLGQRSANRGSLPPAPPGAGAAHRPGASGSAVDEVKLPALATLRLLSGARAGQSVALVKQETTLGRAGVQVVAILAAADAFRLRRVEGNRPVTVNGRAVDGQDVDLHSGDIIELGDTRLEFIGIEAEALRASGT